jgi:hypothetical protein
MGYGVGGVQCFVMQGFFYNLHNPCRGLSNIDWHAQHGIATSTAIFTQNLAPYETHHCLFSASLFPRLHFPVQRSHIGSSGSPDLVDAATFIPHGRPTFNHSNDFFRDPFGELCFATTL